MTRGFAGLKDAGDKAVMDAVEAAVDTDGFVQRRHRSIQGPGERRRYDDRIRPVYGYHLLSNGSGKA